ncbi:hypothetical protein J6590_069661 [Homalodisca vitripennis]|nr:hypothetical protein J6590_069661 [Homalodisca vitripennis]
MHSVLTWRRRRWPPNTASAWAWGLSGAPDAPHAALFKLVSPHSHSTESRGVGKQEKLSVVQESNIVDQYSEECDK